MLQETWRLPQMVLQQIEKQKQKQKKQYKHLRTYAHTREAIYVLLSVIVNSIKTVSLNTQLITKTNAKQSVHIGYESDHSNVAKHDNEHAQC